jgi:hypothetical protein
VISVVATTAGATISNAWPATTATAMTQGGFTDTDYGSDDNSSFFGDDDDSFV